MNFGHMEKGAAPDVYELELNSNLPKLIGSFKEVLSQSSPLLPSETGMLTSSLLTGPVELETLPMNSSGKVVLIAADEFTHIDLQEVGLGVTYILSDQVVEDFVSVAVPELVILDLSLSIVCVAECCRFLKADRSYSSIPILMLLRQPESIYGLGDSPFRPDDYLAEPFTLRHLIARMNALLRRSNWLKKAS